MLIPSSDEYGHTKPITFETSFRRIDCRRRDRARVNQRDPGQHGKTSSFRKTSYDRVEGPRAGSLDLGTRLSGLSFRKYRLAVVLVYSSAFLANSQGCREGSRIHESIEVERL
jgi:hypothetical protein